MRQQPDRGWEHFEHDADVGILGWGPTLATAFEQAALALTAVVCDPMQVKPLQRVVIECVEAEPELLLVDWLNAVVFEMATRHMLFGRFEVALSDDGRLSALAWGEPVDLPRHQPTVEVKGATYTELAVQRQGGDWVARCVVDV